jgi:Raf kinase inhibitor-like YbhB/YbcL family protein
MTYWVKVGIWAAVLLVALGACGNNGGRDQEPAGISMVLGLESSAFANEATIPQKYTCDGEGGSPPLSWAAPPAATQSLALIVDDPDAPAGTWVHWVLFNLAPTTVSLPEDVPADETVLGGGVHGANSWKQLGYGGPCPPKGSTHHYFFKLYALDTTLNLDPGTSKRDVEQAMAGHILAGGQLIGLYGR